VIPELAYPDLGAAIDWLCSAFGFTLRIRIADHRAQLNVGDGAVALTTLPSDSAGIADLGAAHSVLVRVEDVESHHQRALQHGARVIRPPADHPYGERQYTVEDVAGRRWTFSQSLQDVAPESWGGVSGRL
jgi:uncharacterized glyoxalase superfamily protein PhnB